jgi:hypothetical protein
MSIYLSENLERVFKLQKRAARVILDVDTRERSPIDYLKIELHLLPLHKIKIERCCVIYNRVFGQSTQYIWNKCTLIRNVVYGSRSNRYSKLNLVYPTRYERETEGGKSF